LQTYTLEEIRRCFGSSTDFNEIFDAFQSAINQQVKDVEPYRLLFWNHALTADEVRLFGEKLAHEFPDLAYDVYLWLASIFEVTQGDNYELAVHYYQKAAPRPPRGARSVPRRLRLLRSRSQHSPLASLIEFVKHGVQHVKNPINLYKRLAYLYELAGDPEQGEYYRRLADEASTPGKDKIRGE